MPGTEPNNDLIERCIKNDRRAQEKLYKQFLGPMWSICRRYISDEAEALEVLNDGYLKAFQNLHKFDPSVSSLYTWMSRIIINTAIDCLRKKKVVTFKQIQELDDEFDSPVDDIADCFSGEDLIYLINQLPETTKIVFNLYVIEGYKHEEIAAFLNITKSTSRWHLTEARKRLRELLAKNG